ncbi:hypothetical protein JHK85_034661 [Glycine max]|nr:hypothetical protein JHK85_034661 [Glycine max]
MSRSGTRSNSSDANTGTTTSATTSLGSRPRSKNSLGNRTDIGWKHGTNVLGNGKKFKCNYCSKINNGGIFRFKHHFAGTRWDSEPCSSVPEEVKMFMMKFVAEVANASEKRRKLNNTHEEGVHTEGMETNTTQSGIEGKWIIGDQNCHSLDYRVEPSSCFYKKVHQVKLKYGSNHLAKLGQKMNRVTSLLRLLPNIFRIVDVPCYKVMTKDNNWYHKALHWGNEGHRA